MTEMVERVAAAILAKVPVGYGMTEAEAGDYARAAVEAMREPTGAMEDAAYNTRIPISHNGVHAVWQAMIDAALKQESR